MGRQLGGQDDDDDDDDGLDHSTSGTLCCGSERERNASPSENNLGRHLQIL